jgi:hypothetical protein
MPRLIGILGAIGTIVFAVVLLAVMLWVIGQPNLVSWWRAEYLIGGFVAMLIGAIVWIAEVKSLLQRRQNRMVGQQSLLPKALASHLEPSCFCWFFTWLCIDVLPNHDRRPPATFRPSRPPKKSRYETSG